MNSNELFNFADTLEKIAEYIEELETENASLEKAAHEAPVVVAPEKAVVLEKLANAGYSEEELAEMNGLSDALMKKMAAVTEKPWGFGEAAGPKREKTDPLLEFMLG
jgi:ParB-like chromosome segregation protein Spo0J